MSRNLKACLKNCFPSQPVIHLTVIYYDNKFLLDNNNSAVNRMMSLLGSLDEGEMSIRLFLVVGEDSLRYETDRETGTC